MKSKSLWIIGLIIVIVGSIINGQLVKHEVGGLAREFMRLIILTGVGIFIYGLIQKFRRK